MIPKNNEIYRHFKGNLYQIIALAQHTETGEQMVVYRGLYGEFPVFCRPLDMFMSKVDTKKYPNASQKMRFERVDTLLDADNAIRTAEEEPAGKAADEETVDEIDPLILEFLDADTMAEKRNIAAALHHRITQEMINTLAISLDVVIEDGELEDRYQQLKNCIDTIERYEIERR